MGRTYAKDVSHDVGFKMIRLEELAVLLVTITLWFGTPSSSGTRTVGAGMAVRANRVYVVHRIRHLKMVILSSSSFSWLQV